MDSYDDLIRAITAAGNDNWMYQIRDRLGRWVFMGGLARFLGRDSSGKLRSAVGEIVGIPNDRSAIMRVTNDSNGVKSADYLVPAKNLTRAVAVLDDSVLKARGVKLPSIREQSGIPKFEEMASAAAKVDLPSRVTNPARPFATGREGTSSRDTPLTRDGWELIDSDAYIEERAQRVLDLQMETMLKNAGSNPSIAAVIAEYKKRYGSGWLEEFRKAFREEHQDIVDEVKSRYQKLDLYRRGSVTAAVDRDFRDLPNSFDEMLLAVEKLYDNTRHGNTNVEIVFSGDDSKFDEEFGRTSYGTVVFNPAQSIGNLLTDASILINAGFLKPEHRDKFAAEELERNMDMFVADENARLFFGLAAYEGTPEDFIQYIIAHEWGHHLDFAHTRDEEGRPVKKDVEFDGEQSYGYGLSAVIAQLISENPWLLSQLSRYSSENPREVLAELFAQVFMEDHFGASVSNIPTALKNVIRRLAQSVR